MIRITILTALACLAAALPATADPALLQSRPVAPPGAADPLPPGLLGARLLPGWTDAAGDRVLALELLLEPGWKTYWRSPGDTGLPPHLDWSGSENLAGMTPHWPAPAPIRSGEVLEMGYHDRLVLPLTARPADPSRPVTVRGLIEIGLCQDICVPASLSLEAPPPGPDPDPAITDALAQEPERLETRPACRVTPIPDGLRVAVDLPGGAARLAAVELTDRPEIWVSAADIGPGPAGAEAVVEMVAPTGQPFVLDPEALRLTVLPEDGPAIETLGCAD